MTGIRTTGSELRVPHDLTNRLGTDSDPRRRQHSGSPGESPLAGLFAGGRVTLLVQNDTGADLATPFVPVGIGSDLVWPAGETDDSDETAAFTECPAIKLSALTYADHAYRFGILAQPLEQGELGHVFIGGVCPAKVTIGAAWHPCARLADDASGLVSSPAGPLDILWPAGELTAGEQWCYVRFNGKREHFCVMSASWSPSQGNVNIMAATPCVGIGDDAPLAGAEEVNFKIFAGSAAPLNVRIFAGDIFPYDPADGDGYVGILRGVQEMPSAADAVDTDAPLMVKSGIVANQGVIIKHETYESS